MKLRLVNTDEEFLNLSSIWNEILIQSEVNHIHSTFEWLSTWWKFFGDNKELFIIVAEEDSKILGIAPLMIQEESKFYNNTLKFKQLTYLGQGFTDSAGFIIKKNNTDILIMILDFIYKQNSKWDEIYLSQMDSSTKALKILNNQPAVKFSINENYIIGCPFLPIAGEFEKYYQGLSRTLISKNERYIRKLEKNGETKYIIEKKLSQKLLDEIIQLNQVRNLKNGRKSPFLEPTKKKFIIEVLDKLSKKDQVRIFTIRQNEYLLIYSITFNYNKTISRWNTCYNLDYSKFSLGKILTKFIIRYCFENDYDKCDWMAGSEEHKLLWTDKSRNNHSFSIKKRNIKTSIANSYFHLKKIARKYEFIQ